MADEVTIIVVALIGGTALEECLRAARSQSTNCLAVRRDGSIVDAEGRPVGMADRLDIPAKRRSAVEVATTRLVALIEDTVVPGSGWARAVADSLAAKHVVACGGPVIIADDLPPKTRALTLSEYGRYNERQRPAEVSALPGCNFAFRRDALLEAMRGSDGLVDNAVLRRLKESGGSIVWAPGMTVTFARAFPEGARLKTRFDHGRITASLNASGPLDRMMTAAKALLLPAVLTARTMRQTGTAEFRSVRTFGWVLLQHTAWAAGELAGAVMGPSRGVSQWR
jgi:hypothetical protein